MKTLSVTTSKSLKFNSLLAAARAAGLLALAVSLTPLSGHAAILAPYIPDASTLHLYHLDETAVPSPDAAAGGTNLVALRNGATLGDASFAGFGNAVNTLDGGQDAIAAANKDALISPSTAAQPGNLAFPYCDPVTGAFTFEALVWIGFDPNKNLGTTANGGNNRNAFLQIMSCESTVNASRIFQFRICPTGVAPGGAGNPAIAPQPLVTFENVRSVDGQNQPTIFASIPTNGPDAILSNRWYHVAVSYNGVRTTDGNIKFYWTLVDASRTSANQIPITSVQTTLNGVNPLGTANTPFVIGNIARNVTTAGANFLGRVDEVRISKVERAATAMLFGTPEVAIMTQPLSSTVAVGQPASFNVVVSGAPPFSYQWRTNGTPIPGATNSVYSLLAAQFSDAGSYDVVITNSVSSITSSPPVTLTVRTPINLTWVGFSDWDTNNINWDTNADTVADTAYIEGDNALFNGQGASLLYIPSRLRPSSVVVNSATDYTFSTFSGGGWDANMGLRKAGSGTLTLEIVNNYTGPTTVEEGVLQVGDSLGLGTIGSGPVTNNGGLVFGSTAGATISYITGIGGVTNNAAGTINFTGTNTLTGSLVLNAGSMTVTGPAANGNHPEIILTAPAAGGTSSLNVGGGVTYNIPVSLLGTTASPDSRCQLNATSGTNVFNGPITLTGNGGLNITGSAGSELDLNGALNGASFTGIVILRGAGTNNVINGKIQVGDRVATTDSATWIINSTGNSWVQGQVAAGTMRMGADGVLPSTSQFLVLGGTLDLNGHNQTVAFLSSTNTASPFALNPAGVIASSSKTADSVFTLNTTQPDNTLAGRILDSVGGGTRRVGLTLTGGGTLTLTNFNTYSGDTTISAGTLVLANAATIANSSNIIIAAGATLSADQRTNATFTLNAPQTLKGNGAFNITGSLTNNGSIELKLNKSGTTLTGDTVNGLTQMGYGGTLKLVLSGSALTTNDSFKAFYATSYAGSFANIIPMPAAGLAWDTSTLAIDGTLRITAGPNPTPTNMTVQVTGNQLVMSWPSDYTGWQLQTNSTSIVQSNAWFLLPGSTTTNRVSVTIDPSKSKVFYRLALPIP